MVQSQSNITKKRKRCPNGTRKNKKTGICEPNSNQVQNIQAPEPTRQNVTQNIIPNNTVSQIPNQQIRPPPPPPPVETQPPPPVETQPPPPPLETRQPPPPPPPVETRQPPPPPPLLETRQPPPQTKNKYGKKKINEECKNDKECYTKNCVDNKCTKGVRKPRKSKKINTQPQAQEVQPQAQEVQPEAQEVQPQAQEVQPQAQEQQPQAQEQQPQVQQVEDTSINYELNNISNIQEKSGNYDYLYPHIDDPEFNIKIATKKEFYDTRYDGKIIDDIEEHADKLCNADFELTPHQLFVRNFLSFQTPYNSLLLYHGLGSGKTCSAIGVGEEMRDYNKQMGTSKRIIIVASPNVQENFKLQLFDERKLELVDGLWNIKACTGNKFIKEINPMNMKGLSKENVSKQINRIIKNFIFSRIY